MGTTYFYINAHGPDHDAVNLGIHWLLQKDENVEAVLSVPLLSNLDGVIENVIGEKAVKELRKNKTVIISGVKINLATSKSISYGNKPVCLLAIYHDSKSLDKLESNYHNVSSILAIPWNRDTDIIEWKKIRRAEEYVRK